MLMYLTDNLKRRTSSRGARAVLLDMPFPAIVLFNVSQNTTLLSHIVNKHTGIAQMRHLFWDTSAGFETHELENGLIALQMSIDVLALMAAGAQEFEAVEERLHAALRHEDQGTGAGFAAVVPALWAVRVNRFLQVFQQGEAVAVMAGVVRNTVTDHVCVRACGLVAAAMNAAAPRMLFLLSEGMLQSSELAHNIHTHGALKYAHTAVCAPEGCATHYKAVLLSTHSSDGLDDRHEALGVAGSALLHAEDSLRTSLRMTDSLGIVDGFACPARMFTQAVAVQGARQQRYCAVCADGHFHDAASSGCLPCTNSPVCFGESAREMLPQNCSWGADFRCIPPASIPPL
jgi:hypothetical protein